MPHQCTNCGRAFEDGSKQMLSGCPDCGGNKFQFLPARAMEGSEVGSATGTAGTEATVGGTAPKKAPEGSSGSPSGAPASSAPGRDTSTRGSSASETGGGDQPSAVNRAAKTVRDWVRTGSDEAEDRATPERREQSEERREKPEADHSWPDSTRTDAVEDTREDTAQASARTDVVTEAELPNDSTASESPTASENPATSKTSTASQPPEDAEVIDTPDDDAPGLEALREELNSQFESIRITEPGQYELNLMELFEREEYIIALQEDGKYVIEVPDGWETPDR